MSGVKIPANNQDTKIKLRLRMGIILLSVYLMKLFFCIFMSLAHMSIVLGEIRSGLWNGQPWDLNTLKGEVQKNNPDALAEKAYCMREAWNNFAQNDAKEFQLIQTAYQAKSPLSIVLMARSYLYGYGVPKDDLKARKYLEEALKSEHPFALNYLSNCLLDGRAGYDKNLERAKVVRMEAVAQGVIIAEANLCLSLFQGDYDYKKDVQKALDISAEKIRTSTHHSQFHAILLRGVNQNIIHPALKDQALLKLAEVRVSEAVQLGKLKSISRLAEYYGVTNRPHEAVPLMLHAGRNEDANGLGGLLEMTTGGQSSYRHQSIGQYSTHYRLARLAWKNGNRSPLVSENVAESYLYKWGKEDLQPLKALPILKHQHKIGQNVHRFLGRVYLSFDIAEHDAARGEAHLIYSIRSSGKWILHFIIDCYFDAPERGRDLAKARAVGLSGLEHITCDIRRAKIKNRLKQIELQITPADLKRSNDLVEKRWPLSQEVMAQAVETLIKYGDLPEIARLPQARGE